MSHKITLQTAVASLRKAVAEKGEDYVYPRGDRDGVYAEHDGSPSCIVGHVFADLDPEIFQKLAEYERQFGSIRAAVILRDDDQPLPHPDVDPADMESVRKLLSVAQIAQDHGNTWGEALEWGLDAVRSSGVAV